MESASSEEKLRFGKSTLPPRKNTVEGGGAGKGVHVAVTIHQTKGIWKRRGSGKEGNCRSRIKWTVSATVAAIGTNTRTANVRLLQEPQANIFCFASSLGSSEGFPHRVVSSNSTSLFQRQGRNTNKMALPLFLPQVSHGTCYIDAPPV